MVLGRPGAACVVCSAVWPGADHTNNRIETKTQIGHSIFVLMPHKLLGLLNLYLRLQHLRNNIFHLLQFIRESSPIISQINPRHLEHNV